MKPYRTTLWVGSIAFAWSLLFVWQGLDFSDMGFWLTGYQQFYTYPDLIFPSCWLTCFIGHWVGLVQGGGVIAYKLGYVAVIAMSAIIAHRLLASQLGHGRLLAAMVLLTVSFNRIYCGNWLAYYELTALFYLAGTALLFWGLIGERKHLLLLSGVVLGSNIFIRLPNLLGVLLVSAIWLHAWNCRRPIRDAMTDSFWFLGGFLLGVSLILGLIALNRHAGIYLAGVQKLFDWSGNADSGYDVSFLLKRFVKDHFWAFMKAFSVLFIWGCMAKWISRKKKVFISSGIVFISLLLFFFNYSLGQWQWIVTGICYIILLSIVFLEMRRDPPLALLSFIAGTILFITSAGSNDGISLSIYGTWLALPLTLIWLGRKSDLEISLHFLRFGNGLESRRKLSFESRSSFLLAMSISLALFFQSLASAWSFTFRDSSNRFAMTSAIEHPLLAGTYTTPERARVVTELLDALANFAGPGDELFAYNTITTVHFLTGTRPWLGTPWPDVAPPNVMAALIRQKEQASASLPCVVRATGSTWDNDWPIDAKPTTWGNQLKKPPRIFADFVQRHGYVVSWSNDFFEILTVAE